MKCARKKEKKIIPYILMNYTKSVIKISVGAQINSSPHFRTLETITLSYALAKRIEEYDENKKVIILYEIRCQSEFNNG